MNKFGVIELAGGKTAAAPGWAYVPDMAPNPGSAGVQPANRKRARNAPGGGLGLGDMSARQEAKQRKLVEALDRDGGRDNSIPLPVKSGRGKHTPSVRKIMQSQKTFANHLDDFLAMQALAEANPNAQSSNPRPGGSGSISSRRPALGKKDAPAKQAAKDEDTPMTTDAGLAPILSPPHRPPPAAHAGDSDPFLVSRVPEMPSDEELRKLLAHPPLTYLEARGQWQDTYAARVFCEVCGYWGRVRCMKCGTRVCALDCLETHREECVTRYGL